MTRRSSFGTILVGKTSLLKEGLAEILRSANFRILTSVSCAGDLPSSMAKSCQPLVLIVHTGDDFDDAVAQIELFKSLRPAGRIAIVADRYRLDELASAFRAGATGYFVEVMTSHILIRSLELVMMGETVFPPAFLSFVLDPESGNARKEAPRAAPRHVSDEGLAGTTEDDIASRLSPREKSILRYLIEGDSNKSIARKIDIAEATVKVHVKAILRKIRVHNRTQAAIWGVNNASLSRATQGYPGPASLGKRGSPAVEMISELKQAGGSIPPGLIERAGRADPSIDGAMSKGEARPRK
jgi:two-component system nitrate/nitrite response regulator NarL